MKNILCLLFILIASCKEQKKANEQVIVEEIQEQFHLPESEYVILKHQKKWFWIFNDRDQSNIISSELSESELIEIEKILIKAIHKSNESNKQKLIEHNKNYPEKLRNKTGYEINLEAYQRQYVPILNTSKEKEVWINFFCETGPLDKWHTNIVTVEDGGNCYFNIKINLNKKTYYDLNINYGFQ